MSHQICGGVYDWSTGLIYRGGRYFDPNLGIWLALTPLLVVQGWRKRKDRRQWVLLVCVGLFAVGCGKQVPTTMLSPVCTPTPIPGLGSGTGTPTPTPTPPPERCTETLPAPDLSLRDHTVFIYTLQRIDEDDEGRIIRYVTRSSGLGTVIRGGDEILTHNHYSDFDTAVGFVFIDRFGKNLIVRRDDIDPDPQIDPGSMRIKLKENNLATDLQCTVALLGDPNAINQCNAVQVVHLDNVEKFAVFSTHIVDAKAEHEGVPVVIYDDPDFRINEGSSGGGVYKDGALIANNWRYCHHTVDVYDQDDNWLRGEQTRDVFAAKLPIGIRP